MLAVGIAILSALFFGSSTPLSKWLLSEYTPYQLAGVLYLGAALGVAPFWIYQKEFQLLKRMSLVNWLRLGGAILFGGILGPLFLLFGLQLFSSVSVSMWLNLELVATALLGYFFFKDHLGKYGWLGVLGTLLASVLLSYSEGTIGIQSALLVALACMCWGIDNHVTALIDGISPAQSTFWKGIVAGAVNLGIASYFEPHSLSTELVVAGLGVGAVAYGLSIMLYILASHQIGATRSQMIFASAPLFGILGSVLFLGESFSSLQLVSALFLAISIALLMIDQHSHEHTHEAIAHKHWHRHDDEHHDHSHKEIPKGTWHSHWHEHGPIKHAHSHLPDLHHRHLH